MSGNMNVGELSYKIASTVDLRGNVNVPSSFDFADKLDKFQGVENASKYLYVDADGFIDLDDIDIGDLSNFVHESDVTVSGTTYHVYWMIKPTSSNKVYGLSFHPTSGDLYYIYNNKGSYSAVAYKTDTQYTSKQAASGGTAVSLVTTGEKYTWNNKVDSVTGKGLSTNDYTNEDKSKLGGIEGGAQVNIIESVKVNGTALSPSSKTVNIDLSDYATKDEFVNKPAASGGTDVSLVTTGEKYTWNNKVDSVSGKGLSTNDYTTAEQSKLSRIEDSAQVNIIESINVNGSELPVSSKSVDIDLSDYATKSDISSVYKYKGSVQSYSSLPSNGMIVGDVYNVEAKDTSHGIKAGDNVVWNGTGWDVLAGTVDLSDYALKSDVVDSYQGESQAGKMIIVGDDGYVTTGKLQIAVDDHLDDTSLNPVQNKVIKETFDSLDISDEVYVGALTPTEGQKIWINPDEESEIVTEINDAVVANNSTWSSRKISGELTPKIDDAPSDGRKYVRKDGIWTEVVISGTGEVLDIDDFFDDSSTNPVQNRTIKGRFDDIDSSISTIESDINDINTHIGSIESGLYTANSNIDTIESEIGTINSNIGSVESDITAINSNISSIESELEGVNSNIDTIESEIGTINGNIDTIETEIVGIDGNIDAIEAKIPTQATSSNQLADKAFVNSTVGTNTAIFRGTFDSLDELQAYSGEKTNNDYAFVVIYDEVVTTQVKAYHRYKYNGDEWSFEYPLNNSSFTAVQWSAINSGITSGDVDLIATAVQVGDLISKLTEDATHRTVTDTERSSWNAKQDAISDLSEIRSNASNALPKSGGTLTGQLIAQNNTNYTVAQVRNIILSTEEPSGGSNGDIWIKYIP